MASLVAEILMSAGKVEKEEINDKIFTLSKQVDEVKLKIYEVIESEHKEFSPYVKKTEFLADKVADLTSEIQNLTSKIDNEVKIQLTNATEEFEDLQLQLRKSEIHTRFLGHLLNLHNSLKNIDDCCNKKDYNGAAESIADVKIYLGELSHESDDHINILHSIRTEYLVKREELIYNFSETWNKHLIWTIPDEKAISGKQVFELKLVLNENLSSIQSLMSAMNLLGHLKVTLKQFSDKFMQCLINPIVESCVELQESDQPHSVSISVTVLDGKPEACDVINNLKTVFLFVYKSLLMMKVKNDDGDVSLMQILGELVSERFCEYVIQNCYMEAIPKSSANLEGYSPIISASRDLQKMLIEQEFLTPENEAMSSFTQNVNVLFANKMCKDILCRARNIMKKELFDCVTITPEKTKQSGSKEGKVNPLEPENKLTDLFKFPKCQISSSSQELIELVHEVLNEVSISSTVCAARLFYTSRNIFELYCDIVPTYHKENLELLPQVSALHHNNCMFLAHQLQTLGHKYKSKFPESMAAVNVTYVDLIPRLRQIGTSSFLDQMLRQKQILMDCLKEAQGFQNMSMDDSLSPKAEKAVKQCTDRLQSVQRLWCDVLPLNVYHKAMATLVNSWLENVLPSVICQEDISEDGAFLLTSLFESASKQLLLLFKTSSSDGTSIVFENVKYWSKFQELIRILGASMQTICDRWSSGKGPLANDFTSEEVHQLIRALFQNTDRRAAVLAQIK